MKEVTFTIKYDEAVKVEVEAKITELCCMDGVDYEIPGMMPQKLAGADGEKRI